MLADVARQLAMIEGTPHVILTGDGAAGAALLTADLVEDAARTRAARVANALGLTELRG